MFFRDTLFVRKLFLLIPAILACSLVWYRFSLRPADFGNNDRVSVRIEAGTSTRGIAEVLHDRGVLRSPLAFRIHTRLLGADASLQAGTFILHSGMTQGEIIEALQSGKALEIAVTIPEGFTVTDIDALLVKKNLSATGAFLRCTQECDLQEFAFLPLSDGFAPRGGKVEGYLFPDTYFVSVESFSPEAFLHRLLTNFRMKVIDELGGEVGLSGRSFHEILAMASLIEEEAITDAERPVISGILWKRFDDGRGLGVDATIRYILQKPSSTITAGDLNVDSPYNTRKFRGLPPGPIANSGRRSIEAALRPTDSSYWYYLHDRNGKIHYAVTNEEHNLNRIEYLNK
ncbi:MAG: UPF0755 protein [Candidatus Peregrinibacteria bacterium Greene0416_62]|nr:MAG: UPF0755 protein [Candidatus Peregrinibacteria bacterium Greene0416_62]TSD00197.1 MAG: UPF0755 protein [Candidatus Peregrinibacteria bacterium Greene1014_49]